MDTLIGFLLRDRSPLFVLAIFGFLLFSSSEGRRRGVVYVCLGFVRPVSLLVGRTLHTWDYCEERMGLLFSESTSRFVQTRGSFPPGVYCKEWMRLHGLLETGSCIYSQLLILSSILGAANWWVTVDSLSAEKL